MNKAYCVFNALVLNRWTLVLSSLIPVAASSKMIAFPNVHNQRVELGSQNLLNNLF